MPPDHTDHAPDEGLTPQALGEDPIAAVRVWLDAARATDSIEPTGMTLATVDAEGRPDARVVLLKDVEDAGLVFYTNYRSRKAREMEASPTACLNAWWPALARQVRVRGRVERIPESESDAYFRTRPRGSQLGAWASDQSEVVPDRDGLERRFAELEARYRDADIPRPPHWGGYRLIPDEIEFWQGRPDRLHDRIRFTRTDGSWRVERLAP